MLYVSNLIITFHYCCKYFCNSFYVHYQFYNNCDLCYCYYLVYKQLNYNKLHNNVAFLRFILQPTDNTVKCVIHTCLAVSHTLCLAKHFLKGHPDEIIPVLGACPRCKQQALWGDVMRLKAGCYQVSTRW